MNCRVRKIESIETLSFWRPLAVDSGVELGIVGRVGCVGVVDGGEGVDFRHEFVGVFFELENSESRAVFDLHLEVAAAADAGNRGGGRHIDGGFEYFAVEHALYLVHYAVERPSVFVAHLSVGEPEIYPAHIRSALSRGSHRVADSLDVREQFAGLYDRLLRALERRPVGEPQPGVERSSVLLWNETRRGFDEYLLGSPYHSAVEYEHYGGDSHREFYEFPVNRGEFVEPHVKIFENETEGVVPYQVE